MFQDRLGPLPTSPAGFNTAVSAAVQAAAAAHRDLAVSTPASTSGTVVIPTTTPFFQATTFHNSQQTPPTTPLSVSTVSSHEPLFTISDHFVNGSSSGHPTFTTVVNGNTNSLTTIQGRKINENSLVVSVCFTFIKVRFS